MCTENPKCVSFEYDDTLAYLSKCSLSKYCLSANLLEDIITNQSWTPGRNVTTYIKSKAEPICPYEDDGNW